MFKLRDIASLVANMLYLACICKSDSAGMSRAIPLIEVIISVFIYNDLTIPS